MQPRIYIVYFLLTAISKISGSGVPSRGQSCKSEAGDMPKNKENDSVGQGTDHTYLIASAFLT